MANYSPAFIAAMRHDYENTKKSLARIATEHGVSERTVNRMRDREGWGRRSEQVRDLLPAVQALQEATKLLVERRSADDAPSPGALPPPERGRSPAEGGRVGVNDDAEIRPPPQPSPLRGPHGASAMGAPQGEGVDRPSCTTIERIERLVERELEAEEAARKSWARCRARPPMRSAARARSRP